MMELGSSNRKVTKKSKALFDAEHLYQIFIMVSVGLLTLTCIFPFIYVIGMSFASEGELLARGNFLIIPSKPIIASYKFILNQPNFMSALTISALRTVIGTFMALVVTLIACLCTSPTRSARQKVDTSLPHCYNFSQWRTYTLIYASPSIKIFTISMPKVFPIIGITITQNLLSNLSFEGTGG